MPVSKTQLRSRKRKLTHFFWKRNLKNFIEKIHKYLINTTDTNFSVLTMFFYYSKFREFIKQNNVNGPKNESAYKQYILLMSDHVYICCHFCLSYMCLVLLEI